MNPADEEKSRIVRDYHERTKHRLDRHAASLGYMDWANQPHPFRSFAGAEQIDLPHPDLRETPTYDGLFLSSRGSAGLDNDLVARLFFHSLALSAWKQAPLSNPWSLRINPSSGALHPTEGYLISDAVEGLFDAPGVFHYAPFRHQLERRCRLSVEQWRALTDGIPGPCLLIGLSSIYWRESWKYGERAFRYCNHDVGHAIGAIAFAARTLGWETRLLETVADEDLDRLLGAHLQKGIEAEHGDCLLALFPAGSGRTDISIPVLSPVEWRTRIPDAAFTGEPNRLSRDHHEWSVIDKVSLATRLDAAGATPESARPLDPGGLPPAMLPGREHPAEQIIRQRRSAVDMDGETSIDRAVFYQILQRTLPAHFPFETLPWAPRASLAIFVHRVDGLEQGLYVLARNERHEASLRRSLKAGLEWRPPEGCPDRLRFYRLAADDMRQRAKMVSCHQDIAGESAISLGMLTEFDAALVTDGACVYPRLFWETGLIGQVLYLEAEAAGVRGAGIGCFFDDLMHDMLGITDRSWQSLYHFTIGGPIEDPRLKTLPPYTHMD
jgi:SagB-type dehydrogenase family enzyme